MNKKNSFGSRLFMGLVFLFLYAPILLLIIFSFNAGNSSAVWKGFSLKWYVELFQNRLIMQSVYTTLLVSVLATLIATVAGTFAAIGFYNMKRRWRNPLLTINNIPMMNADIVTGVSLCLLFVAAFGAWNGFVTWMEETYPTHRSPALPGLYYPAHRPHHLQHPLCDPVGQPQAAPDGQESHRRGAGPGLHLDAGVLEGGSA